MPTPMDQFSQSQTGETAGNNTTFSAQEPTTANQGNTERSPSRTVDASNIGQESAAVDTKGTKMTDTLDQEAGIRQSIEVDHTEMNGEDSEQIGASERLDYDGDDQHEDVGNNSLLSETTDDSSDQAQAESSYSDHPGFSDYRAPHVDDGDNSSSHNEATDEDVFSDKSPRSSLGSYDCIPEPGKSHRESDSMTTLIRSPRISDISQYEREYEKEEFIPTIRGTPRPPFRTPSDVRAMQMSSPPASVLGSPRSAKRQFPTVSRLGTPNASTQYSPKRMSTPPRFKGRKEAPLVLLHVVLLPLRWVWGDLLNNLDTDDMSDQVKSLRESWRILQDRVGDTVSERGVLLAHPQNDYEVLEERILEALELPLRRRARILECGHYLGPSNEMPLAEDEESEDEWGSERSRATDRRHWCGTCKDEIRYNPLGSGKTFRVKVYASNGMMKAGAWEACWKQMERVDVELEPIVESAVQEELVRLAAVQQERELAHQEEADIAKEVAEQMEKDRKEQEHMMNSRYGASSPQPGRVESPVSAEERQRRDEERLREIYGHAPPPSSPAHPQSRNPSINPQDSYMQPPSPSPSPYPATNAGESHEQDGSRQHNYQNASLPELMLHSVRVLMQDRKNMIILTLTIFILVLALRNAPTPTEPPYEPVIHRMRDMPVVRRAQVANMPQAPPVQMKVSATESFVTPSICDQPSEVMSQHHTPSVDPIVSAADYEELPRVIQEDTSLELMTTSSITSYESESEPESTADQADYEDFPEATTGQDSSVADSTTIPAAQESVIAVPVQDAPGAESAVATSTFEEESIIRSRPTPAEEIVPTSASVCTVYEPCSTREASQGNLGVSTFLLEETETETVTEKKVVRVVQTVTETELETSTMRVAPTDTAAKPFAESMIPKENPDEDSESGLATPSEPDESVIVEAIVDEVDL